MWRTSLIVPVVRRDGMASARPMLAWARGALLGDLHNTLTPIGVQQVAQRVIVMGDVDIGEAERLARHAFPGGDALGHVAAILFHQPGLVLGLPVGRDALVQIRVFHRAFSFKTGDRAVDRPDELGVALRLLVQPFALPAQCRQPVETRRVENGGDVREGNAELSMEEDLLQPQQFLLPVVTIAVLPGERRPQQADLVVVMQGPDRHPGQLCHLCNRQCFHHPFSAG